MPIGLAGFPGYKGIPKNLEEPGIGFTASLPESVVGWANLNVDKANLSKHRTPALTRNATGNSSSPEIDILDRLFGYGFAVGDIAKLQVSPRAQNAPDLGQDPVFVGA